MTVLAGVLFGLVAHPAGVLVWSDGGAFVALALAAALLLSAAGLVLERERADAPSPKSNCEHSGAADDRLPTAA